MPQLSHALVFIASKGHFYVSQEFPRVLCKTLCLHTVLCNTEKTIILPQLLFCPLGFEFSSFSNCSVSRDDNRRLLPPGVSPLNEHGSKAPE